MKVCVVGVGNWGMNHIKTLLSLGVQVGCVDNDMDKLKNVLTKHGGIDCHSNIDDSLIENYSGYVIATPPSTHSSLAKYLLTKQKTILVEKPLSLSVAESIEIKSALDRFGGKIVVGHLLLFHPAIVKIKSMIKKGDIGKVQYIYSNRLNLGTVRKEENVFWSFAPHDISIFQYFTDSFPTEVFSHGGDFLQKDIHDTTITYLKYPEGINGHIFVSWLHPFKEHRLIVIGSKGSLHFEDSFTNKPLLFYEKDLSSKGNHISLKNKLSKEIRYDSSLPLKNELSYFLDIIDGAPITKGTIDEGIDTIKILEMASNSLKLNLT